MAIMAKVKDKKLIKKSKDKVIKSKKNKMKTKLQKKTKLKLKTNEDKLGTMSVDEFLSKDFGNDSESEELSDSELLKNDDEENNVQENMETNGNESSEHDSDAEMDNADEAEKHKKDLEKLKKSDPEFYKFLQENDKKLLQFNLSDEEDKDEAEEEMTVHKPDENLEVASDESDYEAEDDKPKDSRVITLKLIRSWQSDIQTDKTNKTIVALTQAFHAALFRVVSKEDDEPVHYRVEGSAVFNGVIQLCVLELGPAIRRFLGLNKGTKQPPHKCKKFIKIKRPLRSYFGDLLRLLNGVGSSNIQTVLLKHLHFMANLLVSFPNITKSLVKNLINLWGTGEDTVRVLAFFCILRITNNQQASILSTVLKSMYITYVKNTKFVNFKGLPVINFMRRSLVEMFALDPNVSYQHVFLYIRQLAIHLRNAITLKKTEDIQAVYNWQFVNSLRLWGNLLSVTYNKPVMQQLVYPFVQVCLGTIKLVPTTQYYPLRFHVIQILMDLSKDTGVFIPILPFILEVLTSFDFNRKHQKVSMKPVHFTCILRTSKSQQQENGFKDVIIDMIYGSLLEYLSAQSHTVGFPDLSFICTVQIKDFLKKCKNPNYNRKMKQVLEKIQQNSQMIEKERAKMTFKITDFKFIEGWEAQIKNKGTPLTTYYESWNKIRTVKKNKMLTDNDALADYNIPTVKKIKKKDAAAKNGGPVELFPSDSEDEATETNVKKRGKRGGKNVNKKVVIDESGPVQDGGQKDIVEDIKLSDW